MERSEKLKVRIKEVVQNGELVMSDEIELFQWWCKRFNLYTPAEAARHYGISFNGMKKRIASGKEMVVELKGQNFISVV